MATSTEQINNLIQAGNEWKESADALLADRQAHQAAYETLSSDLRGVVADEMAFAATIDPDDPAPTGVNGGVFNTIVAAVNAAPASASIQLSLLSGKTHEIASFVPTTNRAVKLVKSGASANPVIRPQAFIDDNVNALYGFNGDNSNVLISNCDIDLTADKVDAQLGWSNKRNSLVSYRVASRNVLGLSNCTVTGVQGRGLMSGQASSSCILGLYSVTLDGAMYGVRDLVTAMLSNENVTLLNGAALTQGGTVGTNLLQN